MGFRKWLLEVGMGGGGVGSGMVPPLQRPETTAMADYHGDGHRDPTNQYGRLPPAKKKRGKK
jgi:hypothetical protein